MVPDFVEAVNLHVGLPDLIDLGQESLIYLGTRTAQFVVALLASMEGIA